MRTILKLFEHAGWANAALLDTLRGGRQPVNPKALRLFAHLLQAERVWLTRLQGQDSSPIPLWPDEPTTAFCAQAAERNRADYAAFLAGLSEERLDEAIRYRNQSGTAEFETAIRDILIHVALHGQYHRGQINAWLRAEGDEPAGIDYILFVR